MKKLSGIKKLLVKGFGFKMDISSAGSGKTTRAVRWIEQGRVKGEKRAIVVINKQEKDRLMTQYILGRDEVITMSEVPQRGVGYGGRKLWVDSADMILQTIFEGNMKMMSMSKK